MTHKRLTPLKLAERLAIKTGLSPDQVESVLTGLAEVAYSEARNGIPIPGIGVLNLVERPARQMVMRFGPDAGKVKTLPALQSLKFRISRLARDMVLGPAKPMPDLFKDPDFSPFVFSTTAPTTTGSESSLSDLAPTFAPVRECSAFSTKVCRLPDLRLTTGRIVAADGLFGEGESPLSRTVPPGLYPLALVLAKLDDDERVALAAVRFDMKPVATWEVAIRATDATASKAGESAGYGVDSGMGSFSDEAISALVNEVEEEAFADRLSEELHPNQIDHRAWVHIDSAKGSRAIFKSGGGDGTYTSYFGLDERGQPVALVTDFKILKWGPTANK